MSEYIGYWIGLLAFPVAVLAWLGVRTLYALGTHVWAKWHTAIIQRVRLRPNPVRIQLRGTPAPPPRAKYEDSANKIRDALIRSPRALFLFGLGWYVVIGREAKDEEAEKE